MEEGFPEENLGIRIGWEETPGNPNKCRPKNNNKKLV